jgi:hypothetical protein
MANNRNPPSTAPSRPGVPLKPALARAQTTPRLAQNTPSSTISTTITSTSTPPFRPKLQESEFRPKLNNLKHTPSPLSSTRPTAQAAPSYVTPQSLTGKTRAGQIINSTPTTQLPDEDTPSHARKRPLMISPTNSEPAVRRPQLAASNRAKSVVGSVRPANANVSRAVPAATSRPAPTVRGFVKTPDAPRSNASRLQPPGPGPARISPVPTSRPTSAKLEKDSSPMFFHASDVKSQQQSQPPPPVQAPRLRKTPSFLHANGQQQTLEPKPLLHRSSSPVLSNVSAVTDSRSRQFFVQSPVLSDLALTPTITSPPLSAVSSASNYFTSPTSPPKNNIHLSYRKGASQIFALGGPPLPFHPAQTTQRKTSAASLRNTHLRSTSLSSIDTDSPDVRRQSHPIPAITEPVSEEDTLDSPTPVPDNGADVLADTSPSDTSPSNDVLPIDPYAEARRERKVLDLEISNSSLLAINKSLERELRKQKAELKRFRRLSRAGQFAVAQRRSSDGDEDLSTLDEETDLPDFDDDDEGARPSSPFHSQPDTDSSDEESTDSSAVPLSPGAQAARDDAQRAEDESRLRLDLSRHRELLMDTQRMNQSLQRCLYWTEGLIKDGRKALEYQVVSSEVKLGGRILSVDDADEVSSQVDDAESVHSIDERPGALPDFGEPDRRSVGSEMDSGIDLMGKRGTLTMARDNPHHSRMSQP